MNGFPILRQVFLLLGLIYTKRSLDEYRSSRVLTTYGLFIILATISFNALAMLSGFAIKIEAQMLVDKSHALVGAFITLTCFVLLFIVSASTSIAIFLRRNEQTRVFNCFNRIRSDFANTFKMTRRCERKFERKLTTFTMLLLMPILVGPAVTVLMNLSLPSELSWLHMLVLYALQVHYYIGHLFELVLVEKIQFYFSTLSKQVACDSLRRYISCYSDLWRLTCICIQIFDINKIICLAAVTFTMAIYWFFQYDLQISVWPPLFWQLIISIVFSTCHSWHRLSSEVCQLDLQ